MKSTFDLKHQGAVFDISDEAVEVEGRDGRRIKVVVELSTIGSVRETHNAQVDASGVVVAVEVGLEPVGHEPQGTSVINSDVRDELKTLRINSKDPLQTRVGVPGRDGGFRQRAEVDFTVGIGEKTSALGSLVSDHDDGQRGDARVLQGLGGHGVKGTSSQGVVVEHALVTKVRDGHANDTIFQVEGLANNVVVGLGWVRHQRLVLETPGQVTAKVVDDQTGGGSVGDVDEHVVAGAKGGELFVKGKGGQQRTLTQNLEH